MSTDLKFDVSALDRASQVFVRLGAAIERFERKIDKLDGKDAKVEVEVGTEKADREIGQFARNLKRRLEAATSNLPDIDIDADASEAEAKLNRLRQEMKALGDAHIGVDIDAAKALAEVKRIKAELAGVSGDKRAGVDVRANAGAAMADLALINREIDRIDGRKAKVTIDVDKSVSDSIVKVAQLGRALGTLAIPGALVASLPTLAALGSAAVQASGAVALIPAAAVAAGAAFATLKLGFKGFGDAIGDDPKKAAEALAKLSPAAREAAQAISGLAPAWRTVQQAVQERLFQGIATQLQSISATYLPNVKNNLVGVSAGFNTMALSVGKLLTAPRTIGLIDSMLGNVRKGIVNALGAVKPFVQALIDIGAVGATFLPQLGTGLTGLATKFAAFIDRVKASGALSDFIQGGITAIGQLSRIIGNVGSALLSIFRSSQTAGANLLQTLQDLTGGIAGFLKSAEGKSALQSFFGGIKAGIDAIRPGLAVLGTAIVGVIKQIGDAGVLKAAGEAFSAIARNVAPLVTQLGSLAGPLTTVLGLIRDLAPVLVPAAAALAGLWAAGKLMSGFSSIAGNIGTFKTALGGMKEAAGEGGAMGAIKKLAAGLGGGGILGVALAGVGIALDLYAQKQANAAQAAAEHKSNVDTLAGTLDKLTGAATTATRAQVAQDIASRKLSDGTTSYATALNQAHISIQDYTDAASGNEQALAKVNTQLFTGARAALENSSAWSNNKGTYQAAGITLDQLTAASIGNVQAQDEIQKALDSTGKGWFAWKSEVQGAVGPLSELGSTLGAAAGTLAEAQQQTKDAATATRDFGSALETIKPGLSAIKDGAAPLPALVTAFQGLGESAAIAAKGAGDAAAQFGGVGAGADAASASMQASRQSFIDAAVAAGMTQEAAGDLATKIGLIPAAASTNFSTNASGVQAEVNTLAATFQALPGQKTVTVESLTADAEAKLTSLGFTVQRLPNGQVVVTANTDAALGSLQHAVSTVNSTTAKFTIDGNVSPANGKITQTVALANGSKGTITVDGNPSPADGKIHGSVALADGSKGTITIDGNQTPANGKINATVTYANGRTGTIQVSANTAPAQSGINSFITQNNGRRINILVTSTGSGGIASAGRLARGGIVKPMADGGTLKMATGGYATPGMKYRPMAGNVAQVVPRNTQRIVGDNMLSSESYIPINGSARSRKILGETAKAFGYALAPLTRSVVSAGGPSWNGSGGGMDFSPLIHAMNANTGQVRALRGDVDQSTLLGAVVSQLQTTNRLLANGGGGSAMAGAQTNRNIGELGPF